MHNLPSHITVDPEVSEAVHANKPVVALESTILTHGIPYPHNLEMARDLNKLIRAEGAIPATIALVKGCPTIGATDEEIEYLCQPPNEGSFIKISRRDLAYAVAHGITGGTTIAGTMILAHLAGIRVFATGGLGGVHRGADTTMDISADLEELGRTPVAVVSAGAKAILDLEKTFEYLETKGVHVSTYGPKGVNLPAFYSRDSGIPSPFNFETPKEAAAVIHANSLLQLQSGMLFCVPAPHEFDIPAVEVDAIINKAVISAQEAGIKGKDITPFLLNRILELTDGRSLESNVGFVKNNIKMGVSIAKALSEIANKANDEILPSSALQPAIPSTVAPAAKSVSPPTLELGQTSDAADCLVVGAVAIDLTCDLTYGVLDKQSSWIHTSNQGAIHRTPGGVGFNLCLATTYASSPDTTIRMISAVGPEARDLPAVLNLTSTTSPDLSGVLVIEDGRTAQYIAMHDCKGDLILACADMGLVEQLSPAHIKSEFARAGKSPHWVGVDANLNREPLSTAILCAREAGAKVLLEPTSVMRAQVILELGDVGVTNVWPNPPAVDVMTPNSIELEGLFSHARELGLFERQDWWDVIDAMGTTTDFQTAIAWMARESGIMEQIVEKGLVQMAVHLLPFTPNLFVKMGELGVITVQLVKESEVRGRMVGPRQLSTGPGFVMWRGTKIAGQGENLCVLVRHHAAHKVTGDIVSVTGAGDSFAGVLLSELVAADKRGIKNILADVDAIAKTVERAQKAAVLTLMSRFAISPAIKKLK
ncbi:Indigoidine synthase A like protein-domain-containing protein [Lipomyces starkeyi]